MACSAAFPPARLNRLAITRTTASSCGSGSAAGEKLKAQKAADMVLHGTRGSRGRGEKREEGMAAHHHGSAGCYPSAKHGSTQCWRVKWVWVVSK